MSRKIQLLVAVLVVAGLALPGVAFAKKGKKRGLGKGGVPALRDQVVALQATVLALDVRLGALEGLAIDDDGDLFTENAGDCDDTDASVFPGATEVANGVDDDCNGIIDDVAAPPAP